MLPPGQVVGYRCPCCETCVGAGAWHSKDRLTTFLVGESVLGWPKAARALKDVCNQHQVMARSAPWLWLRPGIAPHWNFRVTRLETSGRGVPC